MHAVPPVAGPPALTYKMVFILHACMEILPLAIILEFPVESAMQVPEGLELFKPICRDL